MYLIKLIIKILRYYKWKRIIQKSGLFNPEYYLATYPEVNNTYMSPLKHFVYYGVYEQNNPSESFDTSFYLKAYLDVDMMMINQFVHYISFGSVEGRACTYIYKHIVTNEVPLDTLKVDVISDSKVSFYITNKTHLSNTVKSYEELVSNNPSTKCIIFLMDKLSRKSYLSVIQKIVYGGVDVISFDYIRNNVEHENFNQMLYKCSDVEMINILQPYAIECLMNMGYEYIYNASVASLIDIKKCIEKFSRFENTILLVNTIVDKGVILVHNSCSAYMFVRQW